MIYMKGLIRHKGSKLGFKKILKKKMYPIILPINLTPAFSNSATNSVFSDKNPYPDHYIQCKLPSIWWGESPPILNSIDVNSVFSDKNTYPDHFMQCELFSIPPSHIELYRCKLPPPPKSVI